MEPEFGGERAIPPFFLFSTLHPPPYSSFPSSLTLPKFTFAVRVSPWFSKKRNAGHLYSLSPLSSYFVFPTFAWLFPFSPPPFLCLPTAFPTNVFRSLFSGRNTNFNAPFLLNRREIFPYQSLTFPDALRSLSLLLTPLPLFVFVDTPSIIGSLLRVPRSAFPSSSEQFSFRFVLSVRLYRALRKLWICGLGYKQRDQRTFGKSPPSPPFFLLLRLFSFFVSFRWAAPRTIFMTLKVFRSQS